MSLDAIEVRHAGTTARFDLLALDEALQRFEKLDERRAQVVKLRYFVGMSVEETAEGLGGIPADGEHRLAAGACVVAP